MADMDLVAWALSTAEDRLASSLPRRWSHVQGVGKRARQVASLFDPQDQVTLFAAALLHDVGYAPSIATTGFHALDGARFLAAEDAPKRICALVAHHSCAYMEAELRGLGPELASWIDEESALRDALSWADMSTTPDGGITNVHDRIEEIKKRYGPEDLVTFFIRQAKSELVAAVERTEDRLGAAGIDYTAK